MTDFTDMTNPLPRRYSLTHILIYLTRRHGDTEKKVEEQCSTYVSETPGTGFDVSPLRLEYWNRLSEPRRTGRYTLFFKRLSLRVSVFPCEKILLNGVVDNGVSQ